MDTSKEYINMCKVAYEIQELRDNIMLNGDFFYRPSIEKVFIHHVKADPTKFVNYDGELNKQTFANQPEDIWLPRQDQLSELIQDWNHKYPLAFFEYIASNTRAKALKHQRFKTIEQFLLSFYMKEQYLKFYNAIFERWDSSLEY